MPEPDDGLFRRLQACRTIEDVALVVGEALNVAFAAVLDGRPPDDAHCLRCMLVLYPSGAFSDLLIVDASGKLLEKSPDLKPSTSAWARLRRGDGAPLHVQVADMEGERRAAQTVARLRGRQTTDLLAWPLMKRAGDAVLGALTAEFRINVEAPPVDALLEAGQAIAAAVSRVAFNLPSRDLLAPGEGLPVIGQQTLKIVRLLRAFSQTADTLLITGPSGVGKTRLSAWCHRQSGRVGRFVSVNLATITDPTMHGPHLFGWKKGTFTDAKSDHRGLVAEAQNGTLFIDEIDKLDLATQRALLQLLDENRYRALGATADSEARTRFIVACNRDLGALVAEGRFLSDLLYRINQCPIEVAPLSERTDEIAAWIDWFLRASRPDEPNPAEVSPEALAVALVQPWPGNLRQLESVIRRAEIYARLEDAEHPIISRRHLEEALHGERKHGAGGPDGRLMTLLEEAARLMAARIADPAGTLTLEHTQAWRGMVMLAVAHLADDDVAEAFHRMGRGAAVDGRNHLRDLRREYRRVVSFYQALGLSPPVPPDGVQ
ncbi:MAG: sigma-54-dependent Fis family transcriptional regulator [Myxococcales bacterium]|nr:sigma-54-dependent Fis family transcriptional regulator [Myxococcales bacterium]